MTTECGAANARDNADGLSTQPAACGAGCGCHGAGKTGRMRWVIGVIVLIAAMVLVVRAVTKDCAGGKQLGPAFAAPTIAAQTPAVNVGAEATAGGAAASSDGGVVTEIGALAELNEVATNTGAVFVYVPGKQGTTNRFPTAEIASAARRVGMQGIKIGVFTLRAESRDQEKLAAQMAVPGVLAMVKGGGAVPVCGEITESKLVQAFVAASNAGGCGSGGCGAGGCGSSGCK